MVSRLRRVVVFGSIVESPGDPEFEGPVLHWIGGCQIVGASHKTGIEVGVHHEKACPLDFKVDEDVHVKVVADFALVLEVE